MSTQFEFTVPPDSTISVVLPEEFRGKAVSVTVRSASERSGRVKTRIKDTSVYALKGLLKGRTEKDLENSKVPALSPSQLLRRLENRASG